MAETRTEVDRCSKGVLQPAVELIRLCEPLWYDYLLIEM
jgi:hypothetical protein